jgi:hypothetical protein
MSDDRFDCNRTRELAPEVSLGIARGEDRDEVLRHTLACQECRREVTDLSTVADDLVLLAPAADPPGGFAERTLALMVEPRLSKESPPSSVVRLPERPTRPRRRLVALAAAAVLVVAAAAGAATVLGATSADRRLAASYRELLDRAGGSSFVVAPLDGPDGRLGTLFAYRGNPSWVYVTLDRLTAEQRVLVQAVMRNGTVLALGPSVLGGGETAWGSVLSVDPGQIGTLRFLATDGSVALQARLDSPAAVTSGWMPARR